MGASIGILYVEGRQGDDSAFRRLIEARGLPWSLTVVRTLADACAHLRNARVDVVAADDRLPDGQAADLVDEVGAAPVVLLTDCDGEQRALEALERIADDYVVRQDGDTPVALVSAIEKCLHRKAVHHRHRQLTLDLHASEQQMRAVLDNVASGIVLSDGQDRLLAVNDRLCRMLGYRRDEPVGTSVLDLTFAQDRIFAPASR